MRFFKLTRMAHILSLIVLMVAAVPLVGFEAGKPYDEQGNAAAMDDHDCGVHLLSDNKGLACPSLMVHCSTLSGVDIALPERSTIVVNLFHRVQQVDTDSFEPEANSPPPRILRRV